MRIRDHITTANVITAVSFAAATLLTATAEHDLFVIMGANEIIAWAFPIMLDCYCVRAFMSNSKGNVAAAIVLMMACQVIAHLLNPHTPGNIHPAAVIAVSLVPPIILWRIHHLGGNHSTTPAPAADALLAELDAARDRAAALAAERDHHAAEVLRQAEAIVKAEKARVDAEQRAAAAEEQLANVAEEQLAAATATGKTSGRSAEENFRLAQQIRREQPHLNNTQVADQLGLTRQRLATIDKQFATA